MLISSPNLSCTHARTHTHSWALSAPGADYKICLKVSGGSYGGTGAYADTGLEIDVADISAIVTPSSSKVGTNVATTVTITGTELVASDDKVRLGNGDCTDGNLLAGTDDTALASPTTFTFTPTAALNNAKVCLKVKDDNRSDETYVDTGVTLTVSISSMLSSSTKWRRQRASRLALSAQPGGPKS